MNRALLYFLPVVGVLWPGDSAVYSQSVRLSADDVVARYIDALGGDMLLAKFQTVHISEDIVCKNDKGEADQDAEHWYKGQKYVTIEADGQKWGFDGAHKWSMPPITRQERPDDYPYQIGDPVFYPLHIANFPGKLSVLPSSDDDSTVRLKVTPPVQPPMRQSTLWPLEFQFDKQTGLLNTVVFNSKAVSLSDYRRVDGILVPYSRTITAPSFFNSTWVVTITSIEFNVDIGDHMFESAE